MRKRNIPAICILIMQEYTHHRVIRVNSASNHQAAARWFFSGRRDWMFRHYITKYVENGKRYAEAWFQINIFGQCLCMFRKRIEI